MWFLLAILLIPAIEIALFVQLGGAIGVAGTLLEVFVSGVLALLIIRAEPHRNSAEIRAALQDERSPASPMAHSALRIIGAIFLLIPGFFTDAVGLILLVPLVRHLVLVQVLTRVQAQAKASAQPGNTGGKGAGDTTIIDAEYETHPEPAQPQDPRLPPKDRGNG